MASLQNFANLVTILLCTVFLTHLNTDIDLLSTQQDQLLSLSSLIGHGVALSEEQMNTLAAITQQEGGELKDGTPLCFLKAYQEVVVKGKIDPQGIFRIFEEGKQFGGISSCSHYYSLLLYRASRLQSKEKVRIEATLNRLLGKQFQSKKATQICIYHYGYNSQVVIKQQLGQILHQEYADFNAAVDVDGSKDNTHMFAKYMLDEKKDSRPKIELVTEPERKGFIDNYERYITKYCGKSEDSIVLLLNKQDVLLSPHSLSIVNNYFANNNKTIAVFKSFLTDHENIESSDISKAPKIYPILALRRFQLNSIKEIAAKISEESKKNELLTNYEQDLLIMSLLKSPETSLKIGHPNEALAHRQPRLPIQQQIIQNFLSTQ